MDRYELAMERIRQIKNDKKSELSFHDFFNCVADKIIKIDELKEKREAGEYLSLSLDKLKQLQDEIYFDELECNYTNSYLNPEYAFKKLGDVGKGLSAIYKEVMELNRLAALADEERMSRILEVFLEVYGLFLSGDTVKNSDIENIIYWYASDYLDDTALDRLRQICDPECSFINDIILNSDLTDIRYLFDFGNYISDTELDTARFMNSLDAKTIDNMARAYVDGFINGYIAGRKDISKKKYVQIRYNYGFERIIKSAIGQFKEHGLTAVCMQAPIISTDKSPLRYVGCCSQGANRQCDYDHRYDSSIYYDKAYADRRYNILKASYDRLKDMLSLYAGPAVVECFGEKEFKPKDNKYAYTYSDKQKKLQTKSMMDATRLQNEYIPSDEISFTIIAWPLPTIGDNYKDILDDIIKINTLDVEKYKFLQQIIIDALDTCSKVHVKGCKDNKTDIYIKLNRLSDPSSETNFENCTADVNIPVGEVFTTPVLKGTNGILHVSNVYINGYNLKNLIINIEDGFTKSISCDDMTLVSDMLLKNHNSLPVGEFAIGTNTLAYSIAKKYDIEAKLPILIAEKLGPHFAFGDTCYSFEEDATTYNPDGKAIVARSNEVSDKRNNDPEHAYFGCHTDITLPYDELDFIEGIRDDGSSIYIIKDGRFALNGLEELNKFL